MTAECMRNGPGYGRGSGFGRSRCCGGLAVHFELAAMNRAPLFVVRHGHAAFDTDTNTLLRGFIIAKQLLEQGHAASGRYLSDTLDVREGFPVDSAWHVPGTA